MFHDLDATLKKLLDDPAAPAELRAADVSFETPQKAYAPAQGTINLFLYEVKENRELRDPVPLTERVGTTFVRARPPVRVDCTYLVTTWSTQTGALRVVEEHRLLSQALVWLSRFATIPARYFQGELVGQPYPPPTMVAQMDGGRALGEFWTALGIPPRPAFNLNVTLALRLGLEVSGPVVTTTITELGVGDAPELERQLQIGGRVLDSTGQGVAGAFVELPTAGVRALTDADGRYLFPHVPAGTHTINVVATAFTPVSRALTVPGRPEEYQITLTPLA